MLRLLLGAGADVKAKQEDPTNILHTSILFDVGSANMLDVVRAACRGEEHLFETQ